jgi:hypothetical protein
MAARIPLLVTVPARGPTPGPTDREAVMTTTEILTDHHGTVESPDRVRSPRPRPTGVLLTGMVAALAVVTTVLVIVWTSSADRSVAPMKPSPSGPPAAYLPGGSVYDEQVPDFMDWSQGYGPGSYLYRAQVPTKRWSPAHRSGARQR